MEPRLTHPSGRRASVAFILVTLFIDSLGFGPRSLIKNILSPQQPWKAPVEEWVREPYAKRERTRTHKAKRKVTAAAGQAAAASGPPKPGDRDDVYPVDTDAST